jgi:hypothetical protein
MKSQSQLLKYRRRKLFGKILIFLGISGILLCIINIIYVNYSNSIIGANTFIVYMLLMLIGAIGSFITPDRIYTMDQFQKMIDEAKIKDNELIFNQEFKYDDGFLAQFFLLKNGRNKLIEVFLPLEFSKNNFSIRIGKLIREHIEWPPN